MNRVLPTESWEQKTLIQWMHLKKIFFWSTPNGGSRNEREMANMKREGLLSGVSDLCVMIGSKILFVELKRRKKKLKSGETSIAHTKTSKEQLIFLEKVNKYPYAIGMVCYGWEEAKEFIENQIREEKLNG